MPELSRERPDDSPAATLRDTATDCPAGATLAARVLAPAGQSPGGVAGPVVAAIRDGELVSLAEHVASMSDLLDRPDAVSLVRSAAGRSLGGLADAVAAAHWGESGDEVHLLAPLDFQVIKAAGVTFADSAIERYLEEHARGDAAAVPDDLRRELRARLTGTVAGSPAAAALRARLVAQGSWSQYLEVALGELAEIFTKAPVLSAVGTGRQIGVRSDSHWNNPEPEVAVVMDAANNPRAATLANDVNLRDLEGRSALLLGVAKDNNASCAVGPWLRLFDDEFGLPELMQTSVSCTVRGTDGFETSGENRLDEISRGVPDLVAQAGGATHQYPDGYALLLGTMWIPLVDRDEPGLGFTHHVGDEVRISNPMLGTLVNWVGRAEQIPPWQDGIRALLRVLSARAAR